MRFLFRSFVGLLIFSLTLGVLFFSGFYLFDAIKARSEKSEKKRYQKERIFAVNVERIKRDSIAPKIFSYGEATSKRTLEIRSMETGRLDFVSEEFVEGGFVSKGQVLFRLDQKDFFDALEVAEIELEDTKAQLKEAASQLDLALRDQEVANTQLILRKNSLNRQQELATSGLTTSSVVESSQLAYSSSEQQLINKQNLVEKSKINIDKLEIQLRRRLIAIEKAERNLKETEYMAPFSGIISAVNISPGSLVSKNERVGILIDPDAIEVKFNLSANEFARVVNKKGELQTLEIITSLEIADSILSFKGRIERVSPEIPEGGSGRQIFGSIELNNYNSLRPGDFLLVEVEEPELKGISVLPASAVTIDGKLFILTSEDRLQEVSVTILRRQGEEVIVSGAPKGAEYVVQRSPQLGRGLKVKPLRAKDLENDRTSTQNDDEKLVELDQKKKNELIEFVKSMDRMPENVKDRLIKEINSGKVRSKTLRRLEKGMEGN